MFKPIPDKDGFSEYQVSVLSEELDQGKVKVCPQGDIETRSVDYPGLIHQANRIFGYGTWDRRIEDINLVHECASEDDSGEPVFHFSYIAKVQIIVQPQCDWESSVREAIGVGHCFHADPGRAHEIAVKRAEMDGTKKALETYGAQFGLGLVSEHSMSEDSGEKTLTEGRAVNGGFIVSDSKAG